MADLTYPEDLKYTKSDEWLRVDGDSGTVGISDYAQDQLNDIVYVELPSVGDAFDAGEAFGVVESVKAAADLTLPVAGEITEVNDALEDEPETLNSDPYGKGWIVKINITDKSGIDALMDKAAYEKHNTDRG